MKRESALLVALLLVVAAVTVAPEMPLPTPGRLLSVALRMLVVCAPGATDSAVGDVGTWR